MNIKIFEKLYRDELISETQLQKIKNEEAKPLSLHWDLHTLLYLGITLFTTAVGILIYENIDAIGHKVIVTVIAILCAGCFFYCLKNGKGYARQRVESPNLWFDYILLLGCLLLLTFIGYIQFEYNVFGNKWGMALFVPMVILFIAAYYFDHLGVLSLAITNLAAWAGVTVTPLQILKENDFSEGRIIYTVLILGAGLTAISILSHKKNVKAHFAFTYKNFGASILFIACLAAMFRYDNIYLLWFLVLALITAYFFKSALKERSFYFLVISVLYAYVGISYVVMELLFMGDGIASIYLGLIYFIASGIGLIRLLIHYNKILKKHDSI
jgi:hypothetical protein